MVEARARGAFLALEPRFAAQLAMALDSPRQLKQQLTLKLKGQAQLERDDAAVAKLGSVVWAVAATVRIAMVYEDLAQATRGASAPPGLSADQLALFKKELDARAAQIDEKAGDFFE